MQISVLFAYCSRRNFNDNDLPLISKYGTRLILGCVIGPSGHEYLMSLRNLFNNYRPVSILSVINKVFEKLLYEQLYDSFVSNNLLSDRQFGFRQFHSTASNLLDTTNVWFINMDCGKINIAVFLDLQKVFDTINHDILLKKLERYGMGSSVLNLLRNYLTDRTQMCSVNGVLSCSKTVTCGVLQGSILGPPLFLIYINDLLDSLEFSSARMFADDTTLTASGE